jgi:hypothetical protein
VLLLLNSERFRFPNFFLVQSVLVQAGRFLEDAYQQARYLLPMCDNLSSVTRFRGHERELRIRIVTGQIQLTELRRRSRTNEFRERRSGCRYSCGCGARRADGAGPVGDARGGSGQADWQWQDRRLRASQGHASVMPRIPR